MPTIYDNIEQNLLEGLKDALKVAKRGDFCVGYFNLRGWRSIAAEIDNISAEAGAPACRLIVGMPGDANMAIRNHYNNIHTEATNKIVHERKRSFAASLARQLTYGIPTASDEVGLQKLAKQLRAKRLQVKFFGAYPLHAKLYLVHRDNKINPTIGYVGSSNLTLAGLEKQGELNIDVLDKDAAKKLTGWFEERWEDNWCLDITDELAKILEQSWAGGPIKPYEIYIKTAYELSKEAIEGSREFRVPKIFRDKMLDFQVQAVTLAVERLNRHQGVIVSDVVGLGKTLVASAIAKIFQEDRGGNALVICPPKLEEMWKNYLHDYEISGETLSLGQTLNLKNAKRYPLVIIDESHNLRNRGTKRHAHVHQYIRDYNSHVVLLTATPYNKAFVDIGNQLRLFLEADADLGIRPDEQILDEGMDAFRVNHPNTLVSSLAAFEHSDKLDDWRELMRMFMIRRTRGHIKANYAEFDENQGQHYLTFQNGERFYFPDRVPKCVKFEMKKSGKQDQYAALYSKYVVEEMIGNLTLPRSGIGRHLLSQYQGELLPDHLRDEEKTTIKNLSRAGARLIGFTRSQLFKRLESSGPAFLLSVRRHILRNAVYLSACDLGEDFPIGDVFDPVDDELFDDPRLFEGADQGDGLENFLERGKQIYRIISDDASLRRKFDWIHSGYFEKSIREILLQDCQTMVKVLKIVPIWNPDADRKLDALFKLCDDTHKQDKLLIFTQFKDTADYLYRELEKRGVGNMAEVFGSMDDISSYVKRFSPISNGENVERLHAGLFGELRVLITTDTLSEGQNLQDAHVVVNFDLPWAVIRLVQRAGRVDRIGQQSREIFCYCFLPEDGIEQVITLRERLAERIEENAELIGSDERFLEGDPINLKQVYDETISLEEQEGETDLISRAYDIWRQATKDDPELQKRIERLPDVVYSAKHSDAEQQGAIAYVKTSNNQHILAQMDKDGRVVSHSQSKILTLLACAPDEPCVQPAERHHELVSVAVRHVKEGQSGIGGQLGGRASTRHRVYSRLQLVLQNAEGTLFYPVDLKRAVDQIYHYPLKEIARDRLDRQLKAGIADDYLAAMVVSMWESGTLSQIPKNDEPIEPHIICSMGLVAQTKKS